MEPQPGGTASSLITLPSSIGASRGGRHPCRRIDKVTFFIEKNKKTIRQESTFFLSDTGRPVLFG